MTNIIRCTLKKSIFVTKKILKWGSIIGILIAALVGMGYLIWSIRNIISSGWETYNVWIISLLTQIGILLTEVPWYVWIIIAIPSIVIGYSYLWCYQKQYPGEIMRKFKSLDTTIQFIFVGCSIGIIADIFIFARDLFASSVILSDELITNLYLVPLCTFSIAVVGLLLDIGIWTKYPCLGFSRLNKEKCIYSKSISDCKLYNSDERSICPYHDKIRAEQSTKNYERRKLYERQRLPPYAIRRNKERKP